MVNKICDSALEYYYETTVGLWCIDQNPKDVGIDWIRNNAFQLETIRNKNTPTKVQNMKKKQLKEQIKQLKKENGALRKYANSIERKEGEPVVIKINLDSVIKSVHLKSFSLKPGMPEQELRQEFSHLMQMAQKDFVSEALSVLSVPGSQMEMNPDKK